MTEREKADFRAQGALENFILTMQENLDRENRSADYKAQFWDSLKIEMEHYIKECK